ncbi:MAG: SlyX protein [Rhodovulum sulfidophilum]|uniref:SlyX protein n=1 Tax=Rhodovulum sulfidophilum TaxID=35806 RepID=A0A2W5ND41_RHOSU|nr:MAG: SlyX protein [Rhodovulum sulfidophilum]
MPGDAAPGDRLTALETALAHAERRVEELNEVVTAQADAIDLMRGQLRVLARRLAAAEAALPGDAPEADQPPPHW